MSKYYTECRVVKLQPCTKVDFIAPNGHIYRADLAAGGIMHHFYNVTYEAPDGFRFTSNSVDCHMVEAKIGNTTWILNSEILHRKNEEKPND